MRPVRTARAGGRVVSARCGSRPSLARGDLLDRVRGESASLSLRGACAARTLGPRLATHSNENSIAGPRCARRGPGADARQSVLHELLLALLHRSRRPLAVNIVLLDGMWQRVPRCDLGQSGTYRVVRSSRARIGARVISPQP
jgi:hypothetical protein